MEKMIVGCFQSVFLLTLFYQSCLTSEILHRIPRQGFDDGYNIPNDFVGGGAAPVGGVFGLNANNDGDSSWPISSPDTPKITNIQVQCEKTHMRVSVEFDRPFTGLIFSKGHFSDPKCVHLQAGSGSVSTVFEIHLNQCGTTSSGTAQNDGQPNPVGSFVESTIIVQYDPLVQEVWDQARKLRCTWYDYYEKSVTFRPFQVNMLNAVTANFLGDNLQCWMQIQSGKGPWSSEVSGIVKIGQTMTMVLGIKDEENKFDMIVRNCVAHDGKRTPIQLVNELGCVIRPKIMSRFHKIKNFGPSANVVSYAYFQAFKFPDSMNVHFQCVIQVCRFNCPEPVCPDSDSSPPSDSYGQPQASSLPTYGQSATVPLQNYGSSLPSTQDTYIGSFSAPSGPAPPPPPPPPQVVSATTSYGSPTVNSLPPVVGYDGPQRRRFPGNGQVARRFGHRQGRQDQLNNGYLQEFVPSENYQYQKYNDYQTHRVRRNEGPLNSTDGLVQTSSSIRVLSSDDVAFKLNTNDSTTSSVVQSSTEWPSICVTFTNTSGLLFISFLCIIIVSLITSVVIGCKRRKGSGSSKEKLLEKSSKFPHPVPQKLDNQNKMNRK